MSGAGFCIAEGKRSTWIYIFAGAVVGVGIATMHYAGMQAMSISGHIRWEEVLVIASIAAGIVLTAAAMWCFKVQDSKLLAAGPIHGSGLHVAFHGHGSGDGGI